MSRFKQILDFLTQDPSVRLMVKIILALVVGTMCFGYVACTPTQNQKGIKWFPDPSTHMYKRKWEIWSTFYGLFWMACMGSIVAFQWYESFTKWHYLGVLGGLALPLLIQPFLFPCITGETHVAIHERYSVKAVLWIAIFSFIGNYWYTHYFYNVLGASYTMPSHDLNGVPIGMFFGTMFYFSFYHVFANLFLRKIITTYQQGPARTVYFWLTVFVLSYIVAFMESLTISGFPCYSFEDRHMAYTIGSCFYGIYFIVSFPMFYRLDTKETFSIFQTAMEALATGMMVLCLLDFVRLGIDDSDFTISSSRPCKLNASLTCYPFTNAPC